MSKFSKMLRNQCFILSMLTLSLAFQCNAQTIWKGVDLSFLSDAFQEDVPIGTAYAIYEEYKVSTSFGELQIGDLTSTKVNQYDSKGFYVKNDSDIIYQNTYYDDGRIQQRDIYDKGKLEQRLKYDYKTDKTGVVVEISVYDGNGKWVRDEVYKGNKHIRDAAGARVTETLNKGKKITNMVTVLTLRGGELTINADYKYNSCDAIESVAISAPGRTQLSSYSDYVYDDQGAWIKRYWVEATETVTVGAEQGYTMRKLFTEEEYNTYIYEKEEAARLEEEQKKKEELEKETKVIKDTISSRGYAKWDEITTKPQLEYELLEYPYFTKGAKNEVFFIDFSPLLPDHKDSLSSPLMNIIVKSPAKVVFPNGTEEDVKTKIEGRLRFVRTIVWKEDKAAEIKIDMDKSTKHWYIKNIKKLQDKYGFSADVIDALKSEINEQGQKNPFKEKKLYLEFVYFYTSNFINKYGLNDDEIRTRLRKDSTSIFKRFPLRFVWKEKE